ncbi:DsbC family protein [Limnohabitans sp. INBF002]|uniref:DsbC family protein n=1 Tax=Limnohabitans sp. INBF002 TaxID=2986280 RepID=UPI002377A3BF|nr:DsbC family protein [Limnohabitans sp. INBF002]BDU52274.1 thiol:disulfide interchange protein DsbC [Limnohabitans sp. INBF002]
MQRTFRQLSAAALLALSITSAWAQGHEANIRKNLSERIPQIPKIEEITPTPLAGIYELRLSTNEIYYSDAQGNFLIQGNLIDTKSKRNLTEEREAKLSAVDFNALPLKDAITIVHGNGKRKLAVFEDPNCGYCKRFERDLAKIDNVTVYLFLMPVLGPASVEKSRNVWCAKDPAAAWVNLMQKDIAPVAAQCNTAAIDRNLDFGRKYKITGTPTLVAQDGTRVPGAINSTQIEKLLADAAK